MCMLSPYQARTQLWHLPRLFQPALNSTSKVGYDFASLSLQDLYITSPASIDCLYGHHCSNQVQPSPSCSWGWCLSCHYLLGVLGFDKEKPRPTLLLELLSSALSSCKSLPRTLDSWNCRLPWLLDGGGTAISYP